MGLGFGGLFRKVLGMTVNSSHKQGRVGADLLLGTAEDPGAFIGRDVETILHLGSSYLPSLEGCFCCMHTQMAGSCEDLGPGNRPRCLVRF